MTKNKSGPAFDSDDLLTVLQNHIGKAKGIRSDVLAEQLSGTILNNKRHCRLVRMMILELRNKGHHICATPQHGYYIAETEKELNETCEFLYRRAMATLKQISIMKKTSLPDLRGQLRLPT